MYVIGESCIDINDRSCVDVCPGGFIQEVALMLVIDPEECIGPDVMSAATPGPMQLKSTRTPRVVRSPIMGAMGSDAGEEPRVFRRGGVSYLRVPAAEPRRSAAFYAAVFGWTVDADRDDPSFEDGTGHVIGHFMADLPIAGEAGVLPYVFVEGIDETLEKVVAQGGEIVTQPYPEGDLRVATFRDPAGNVIGVWQHDSAA